VSRGVKPTIMLTEALNKLFAGLIIGPYMADYGGRKWTIFVGCFVVVVAGIVQCLAINIQMFTAARFLSESRNRAIARYRPDCMLYAWTDKRQSVSDRVSLDWDRLC